MGVTTLTPEVPVGTTQGKEPLEFTSPTDALGRNTSCLHEWRIIPDFFNMSGGRNIRDYAFYCICCLKSRTARITVKN